MRRTTKPRKYDSLIRRAKSLLLAAETRPGGWRLTDLFPRKTCLYITSLEYALDVGYCERVVVLHRAARQRESVTRRVRDGEWE